MTGQVKELDLTLYNLFCYTNSRQVQANVQKFYVSVVQKAYNILKNASSSIVSSLATLLIKVILNVLSQLSLYIRILKTNSTTQETIVPIVSDSFFTFIKSSFISDKQFNKLNQFMIINDTKVDGLYCYFNLLLYKLKDLDELVDLSVKNLFLYMIAISNYENAILLSTYFNQFKKQLIYHLLSQYFKTLNTNKGNLTSSV